LALINDESVVRLIKQLVDYYRTNVSNRFIRPALLQLQFDDVLWNQIESLTERFEQLNYQGFHIDDLYRQISALTKFVYTVRWDLAPTLRYKLKEDYPDETDKLLRDMAINNFSSNVKVFAGLILELYNKLVEIDTAEAKGKLPIYKQFPDLDDIEEKLHGNKKTVKKEQ